VRRLTGRPEGELAADVANGSLEVPIAATFPVAIHGGIDLFCDNLRRYRAGEPLRNVFDKARGY